MEYMHTFQKDDFSFVDVKTAEEQFKDVPDALENTIRIANDCDVKVSLGAWVFPNIEFKKNYNDDLSELAYDGLEV